MNTDLESATELGLPTKIAQFLYAFLAALVTGVFWGTWFGLARSMASLTPETFLETGKAFIDNLGGPMAILLPVTLLASVPVLVALFRRRYMTAFYLTLLSLLALIGVLVITLVINVPIDGDIERWTTSTLPSDWEQIRDRWDLYHAIRTFVALLGLGLVLASLMTRTVGSATNESGRPPNDPSISEELPADRLASSR